jgi:hypothetical protein
MHQPRDVSKATGIRPRQGPAAQRPWRPGWGHDGNGQPCASVSRLTGEGSSGLSRGSTAGRLPKPLAIRRPTEGSRCSGGRRGGPMPAAMTCGAPLSNMGETRTPCWSAMRPAWSSRGRRAGAACVRMRGGPDAWRTAPSGGGSPLPPSGDEPGASTGGEPGRWRPGAAGYGHDGRRQPRGPGRWWGQKPAPPAGHGATALVLGQTTRECPSPDPR